jgi:hypothetical protein
VKLPSTRLIEHLEKQIEDERKAFSERIETLVQSFKDERDLHAATEKRLSEIHQEELGRVLAENKRLQDACERLTLRLGLPSTVAEPPDEPKAPVDPDAPPPFTGLPFERAVKRDEWMRSDAGKRWLKKSFATVVVQPSGESTKEN